MSREAISPVTIAIVLVLLAALSGGIAYWWMGKAPTPDTPEAPAPGTETEPSAVPPPSAPVEATEPAERPTPPPLAASDPVLRDWVGRLSKHPALARWLVSEDLVRRFVAAVDSVARGESPSSQLEMVRPEGSFEVVDTARGLQIDPASYQRYDLAAEVFVSLDIGASVRLYHDFEPLFEEAHAEISEPGRSFRQAFAEAIDRILAVQVPEEEPVLERHLLVYHFADPALEDASPAAKHLLRMGPENARKVQNRLRFLRSALDLDESSSDAPSDAGN
jgi:hypothetical protein